MKHCKQIKKRLRAFILKFFVLLRIPSIFRHGSILAKLLGGVSQKISRSVCRGPTLLLKVGLYKGGEFMKINFGAMAVALIVGLGIGFMIGRTQAPDSNPQAETNSTGIEKLQSLADNEIADYYRLKTLEERYLKADEVLAKIMGVFLADLGIRTNPQVVRAAQNPAASEVTAAGAAAAQTQTISNGPNAVSSGVNSGVDQERLAKPASGKTENRLAKRAPSRELRHEHEIADFLRDSQIEEFEQVIKKSSGFANKTGVLDQLNGRFVGPANVIRRGEAAVWDIEFELKGRLLNGKFEGDRILKLSEKGKVFSNSTGNGNLGNDFREIPVDPEAIITGAGPNTYLQVYYLKSIDSLAGNILRQEDIAEGFKTIGSFQLSRQ